MFRNEIVSRKKNKLEQTVERLFFHHPLIACVAMMMGIPIAALVAVATFTIMIMMPISCLMGWI